MNENTKWLLGLLGIIVLGVAAWLVPTALSSADEGGTVLQADPYSLGALEDLSDDEPEEKPKTKVVERSGRAPASKPSQPAQKQQQPSGPVIVILGSSGVTQTAH